MKKQAILFPKETGGHYVGYEQLVKETNQDHTFFGNDKETNQKGVPEGRKLVITDELLNEWLASHWSGLSLDDVPQTKPDGMDAVLHKRFLNYCQQRRAEARGQKELKQKTERVRAPRERNAASNTVSKMDALLYGSFASKAVKGRTGKKKSVVPPTIVGRLPPNDFKVATFDKKAKCLSVVDHKLSQKLLDAERRKEEEERAREQRKLMRQKEAGKLLG